MTDGEAPIEIVPYDSSWEDKFRDERESLRRVLGAWIVGPIEHIGSTAVPGLAAKPVIDIMGGVSDLDASRPAILAAEALGYLYALYKPDVKHWFCKPSPAFRTHHLHLVPVGSAEWRRQLAFRNYLRAHAATAAEYASLKHDLAKKHRDDREAYTDEKGPFIESIVVRALEMGYAER